MSQGGDVYAGLEALLRAYLSQASVTAALGTALAKHGRSPETLDQETLPEVVAEAMIGLRMFCDPARIGDLMMDLADYCESVEQSGR